MKFRKWILTIGIAALLLSIVGFAWTERTSISKESARVIMRNIGHHLLLHNGDSSSLVLPIKTLAENSYQIHFEKSLAINPDSLILVIKNSLNNSGLSKNYIAEVVSCKTGEIVYSYLTFENAEKSVIPCLGRILPEACYRINMHFKAKDNFVRSGGLYISLALCLAAAFLYTFKRSAKKTKSGSSALPLGKFTFRRSENTLDIAGQEIRLTAKEAEILELLCQHPNEIITREKLVKEIWLDKGVVVGRSPDVFISKLRKKLEGDPNVLIVNIHGLGYRLEIN